MNVIAKRCFSRADKLESLYHVELIRPPAAEVNYVSSMWEPGQLIGKVCGTYSGHMDSRPVSEEVVEKAIDDMKKTKLQTPLEMLHFVFLIENVTRAFTHQLVRYRVGTSFAQESMRFYGKHDVYRVLITGKAMIDKDAYMDSISVVIEQYENMIGRGVPSEDARGVLPTNILTNIFFDCSIKTLKNIFNQRVCCQAQNPEWLPVLMQIREIVEQESPELAGLITAPVERGEPCGYGASFDRLCKWKNGIDYKGE